MRRLSLFVLCMLLCAALAVPTLAAGSASVSVSDSSVHRGDTFTVSISVSGSSIKSGTFDVTYGSAFEFVSYEFKTDALIKDYKPEAAVGVFTFKEEQKVSGVICVLKFKVKNDAKFASDTISVDITTTGSDGFTAEKTTKVTVTCDHKYGSWNKASDSEHSRKCSVCGNVEKKSHTYDHDCDTTCNDCSATRTTTHSFGTDWLSDETGHWHACTICGEKSEFAEHIPGAPAGEYTDQICTVCNYVLATALGHQHKYDETYVTDATSHWTKCLGCGEETEHIAHSFDSDCDTTCDECGYERQVLHKVSEEWSGSAQAHWKVCSDCGARLEQSNHIWDGGTVTEEAAWKKPGKIVYHCGLCGAEWTDEIPALALTEAMPWWGWMLAGAACGAVVVVGVGLAIILPNTLRKSKGRFSH